MYITRTWNPFSELEELQNQMLRAVRLTPEQQDSESPSDEQPDWSPPVDISEDDREYLVEADLPEVSKDDLKITVDNGLLLILGERNRQSGEEAPRVRHSERSYGKFRRRFTLPEDIDAGKVSADFKNGVLRIRLPKTETPKPREIDIHTN